MATTYPSAQRSRRTTAEPDAAETRTEKGISLARGPALILGTILLAAGLYFLYKAHSFPRWSNFTNGTPVKDGNFFFGIFGANGWTAMFTAVCGGLLLFGAAQHLLAKTMSLIVGVALGAAAVDAWISGNVLGMAAANTWTKVGWAACALILLFNTLIPRRRRVITVADGAAPAAGRRERIRAREEPIAPREPVAAREEPIATRREERMATREEPMATRREEPMATREEPMAARDEPLVTRAEDPATAEGRAPGARGSGAADA